MPVLCLPFVTHRRVFHCQIGRNSSKPVSCAIDSIGRMAYLLVCNSRLRQIRRADAATYLKIRYIIRLTTDMHVVLQGRYEILHIARMVWVEVTASMETGSSRVGYGVRQEPRRLVVEDEPLICYLCKDTERDDKKKWASCTVASIPLRKLERKVIYISESYLPPPYLAPGYL